MRGEGGSREARKKIWSKKSLGLSKSKKNHWTPPRSSSSSGRFFSFRFSTDFLLDLGLLCFNTLKFSDICRLYDLCLLLKCNNVHSLGRNQDHLQWNNVLLMLFDSGSPSTWSFSSSSFFTPPTFGLVCNRVQLYFCHSHITVMLMVLWLPQKSQKLSRRQRRRKPHFERFSSFKTPIFFRSSAEKKCCETRGG